MHMIYVHLLNHEFPSKWPPPLKLDKFKGDGSQYPKTLWNRFQQWIYDLYDIPQEKITKIATFQFSDYVAIWYATLSPEITNDLSKFKTAFFKKFTEDDHILDLSILQGPHQTEGHN